MNSSPQNNAGTGQRRTTGADNSDEEEWSGVVECVKNLLVVPICLRVYSLPRSVCAFPFSLIMFIGEEKKRDRSRIFNCV